MGGDLYPSSRMEVFPSFLMGVLTWTAQKTFCEAINSEEQTNMTDTTENWNPSGMSNTTDGVQHEKATNEGGGEITDVGGKATNGDEKATNGDEKATNGDHKAANGGKVSNGGGEAEMMLRNRRLDAPESDVKGRAGKMRMYKVDDMWLTEDQLPDDGDEAMRRNTGRNQIARQGKVNRRSRWPRKTLYYHLLADEFGKWHIRKIERALASLEKRIGPNCVKFKKANRWKRNAVQGRQGDDCSATVGYIGDKRYQEMSWADWCFQWNQGGRIGTIQHEFLHSLGIHHTQSRADRDKYVTVYKSRVQDGRWGNFKKNRESVAGSFGLPYDFRSVMHYHAFAFSKYRNYPTIVTKNRRFQRLIGQRDEVSEGDVKLIRKMYRCN